MTNDNEGNQAKRKILVVCENFVRQNIMRNVLSLIFPQREILVEKDVKEAMVCLYVNRQEISHVFCCHSDRTDSLAFLQMWQESDEFKPLPFVVVVMDENFVRVSRGAEERGAIFVRFPPNLTDRKVCANLIAKTISGKLRAQRNSAE